MLHTSSHPAQAGPAWATKLKSISHQSVPEPHADPCAITPFALALVMPELKPEAALVHARALELARVPAALTTTLRVRHFLAQAAHETMGFRRLAEDLHYRDPVRLDELFSNVRDVHHARGLIAHGPQAIANCVYAGKNGNGDARSFDGWNFRGRGYLHHTGRANYRELAQATGLPLEREPELLETPEHAAVAAAAWWRIHNANAAAERGSKAVSALVNPALAGLTERTVWANRFRTAYP